MDQENFNHDKVGEPNKLLIPYNQKNKSFEYLYLRGFLHIHINSYKVTKTPVEQRSSALKCQPI